MIAEKLGLMNVEFLQPLKGMNGGSGIVGNLPVAEDAAAFLKRVAETFEVEGMMHNEVPHHDVRKIALCGGAGEFLLDQAIAAGADVFLTGEMGYHRYFGHEGEILIGVLGHYQSEQYTIQLLERILKESHPSIRTEITSINTNPIFLN